MRLIASTHSLVRKSCAFLARGQDQNNSTLLPVGALVAALTLLCRRAPRSLHRAPPALCRMQRIVVQLRRRCIVPSHAGSRTPSAFSHFLCRPTPRQCEQNMRSEGRWISPAISTTLDLHRLVNDCIFLPCAQFAKGTELWALIGGLWVE